MSVPPFNIGIVACGCPAYARRYVLEWAVAVSELSRPPALVGLLANGAAAATPMEEAAEFLRHKGIQTEVRVLQQQTDLGRARNAAVQIASDAGLEWTMHLDIDDLIMPHALDDAAALAPRADVIAFGYKRCGDLAAGPRNQTRVYSESRGKTTLDSSAPASGVSPFRTAFWRQSPYRTDMKGGWDTALWLGFAHLGARFVPTARPVFRYRQHADSIFNQRRISTWHTARTGNQLQVLRKGLKGVTVIVPWAQTPGREALLKFVQQHYKKEHPEWDFVLARGSVRHWCKGEAVARALTQAGYLLVVADADCIVEPAALREAVRLVQEGEAEWVVPASTVERLSKPSTDWVLAGNAIAAGLSLARKPYAIVPGGGLFVVRHSDYIAAGGLPEAFVGWGGEDEAAGLVFDALLGQHTKLSGTLWHLWHPPAPTSHAYSATSKRLLQQVRTAAGNQRRMWNLVRKGLNVTPTAESTPTPPRRRAKLFDPVSEAKRERDRKASFENRLRRRSAERLEQLGIKDVLHRAKQPGVL